MPGVRAAETNYVSMKLRVYTEDPGLREQVLQQISSLGYKPRAADDPSPQSEESLLPRSQMITLAIALALILCAAAAFFSAAPGWVVNGLLLLSMPLSGWRIIRKGINGFIIGNMDMNSLMTLAAAGTLFINELFEGALVLFLGAIAEALEEWSSSRARDAVGKLMELTPAKAIVRRDGVDIEAPPSGIGAGETLVLKPGASVPLDCEITEGTSEVNLSAITGESMPVTVEPGADLPAGAVNGSGVLLARATASLEFSTVSRIAGMVEEAQTSKSKTERFIDRFASVYTPAVIAIAAALAFLPPLLMGNWHEWFYRALVMLIIACPCALIISTPAAIVSGLAAAARAGIIIRGGQYLEIGSKIDSVLFDKTGTLTTGKLSIGEIIPSEGYTEEDLLKWAASLESRSEHPLAAAVMKEIYRRDLSFDQASEIQAVPGKGLTGKLGSSLIGVGSERFISGEIKADLTSTPKDSDAKTWIYVTFNGTCAGAIGITDSLRQEAAEAVRKLRSMDITSIAVLSGDSPDATAEAAATAAIDDARGGLLPEDKLSHIKELQAQGKTVLMAGDGINDAPSLAQADAGIAMGGGSADIALESAAAALVGDNLLKLPHFISLSRATMGIIWQNIVISLGLKFVFLMLSGFGMIPLWLAVLADTGLSMLVTGNSLRLLGHTLRLGEANEDSD